MNAISKFYYRIKGKLIDGSMRLLLGLFVDFEEVRKKSIKELTEFVFKNYGFLITSYGFVIREEKVDNGRPIITVESDDINVTFVYDRSYADVYYSHKRFSRPQRRYGGKQYMTEMGLRRIIEKTDDISAYPMLPFGANWILNSPDEAQYIYSHFDEILLILHDPYIWKKLDKEDEEMDRRWEIELQKAKEFSSNRNK